MRTPVWMSEASSACGMWTLGEVSAARSRDAGQGDSTLHNTLLFRNSANIVGLAVNAEAHYKQQ